MAKQVERIYGHARRMLYGRLLHREQRHDNRTKRTYGMHRPAPPSNDNASILFKTGKMCLEATGHGPPRTESRGGRTCQGRSGEVARNQQVAAHFEEQERSAKNNGS